MLDASRSKGAKPGEEVAEASSEEKVLSAIASGSRAGSRWLGPSGLGGLKWLSGFIVGLVLVIVLIVAVLVVFG